MDTSIENFGEFLETQEGLEYKQQLMQQIQNVRKRKHEQRSSGSNDINNSSSDDSTQPKITKLTDCIDITKDDSESPYDLSRTGVNSSVINNEASSSNLHVKLFGLQKYVDELPNVIAKVNAEVSIMSSTLASTHSKNDFVIWTFQLPIDFNGKKFSLPITEANLVPILDEALHDEMISLDVVSVGRI